MPTVRIESNIEEVITEISTKMYGVTAVISNDKIRIELNKMLKIFFPINCFAKRNIANKFIEHDYIMKLEKWWIEDNYKLGLDSLLECRKIIKNI